MEDSRAPRPAHLLIVAAMFLLPVAVAFALYYGKLWRPADSASKGELIDPARPLTVAGLRTRRRQSGRRRRAHRQMDTHLYR